MKFYIATGLENVAAQQALKLELEALGHKCTYDWSPHAPASVKLNPEQIREAAAAEAQGVREAELMIVLLPGGRGTHAELGMAIAWAVEHDNSPREYNSRREPKRVVIVGDLVGTAGRECSFYRHPMITHRFSYAVEVAAWLRGLAEGRAA
jgi:hypothetical protein